MEDQKKLLQFVEWLGANVPELQGQAPEQIVSTINKLSESPEGQEMLQGLINEFESSMTGMFKKGGKLDYLLCLKKGGSIQDCGCDKKIDKKQPGGSIASRLWNKWTGKDKYEDGYGAPRSHVPVRESAHRTIVKAADSPLVQAIPVVGDVADGYVAADYAAKGDYKPAIAAVGAGLVLPNLLESGARYIPKDTWRDALKKIDDIDLTRTIKRDLPDETVKYLDDIKSGKIQLLNSRTPSQSYHNWGPTDYDIDKVWMPERIYDDAGDFIDYGVSRQSSEPWWGWDPVEYQEGGRVLGSDQYRHVSRGEAMKAAMDSGLTRSQARLAYRNQKNAMSSNGFTGNEMKQHARWNMIDSVYPRATESVQRPEPIPTVSSISTPNAIAAPDAGINTSRPNSSRPELLTFTNQNFDSAFGNARKMGLSEFGWNGDRYTTELDPGTPDAYETNPVDLSTSNPATQGGSIHTSGWIAGPGYDPRVTQILKNEISNRRARRK